MKIGLAVGHSRLGDQGAYSAGVYVLSEWDFNRDLVRRVATPLKGHVDFVIYDQYPVKSYVAGINYLAKKLKEDQVDAVIEFHFNSAGAKSTGHEWLYWHSSKLGRKLAYLFRDEMSGSYPDLTSRGAKPRVSKQRGSYFLRKVRPPAVIAEPFIGSNADEWAMINNNRGKLAGVFARAIKKYADE